TAMLAARGRGIGRAVIGTAFAVPSPVSPTPNMRPWIDVPPERLASSDEMVLKNINASLPAGMAPLGAVHEIFSGSSSLFTGVPELDPYGPRDPLGYLGLTSGQLAAVPPQW